MTPEWLWNLSVAVPALLLGWWVWWTAGWLWRRTLWQRVGASARRLAGGHDPVPVWGGWRVSGPAGVVTWRGGLWGPGTTVKPASGRRRWFSELLDDAAARSALGGSGRNPPSPPPG